MLDTCRQLILGQFEAALCTLHKCIRSCPDSLWNAPVRTHPFSQVVFHTLFFADYYLESDPDRFREQAYHQTHRGLFADYEQLQDREPTSLYERVALEDYLAFCRRKVSEVIASESSEVLAGSSGFPRRDFSRAELHVYNLRHIQHHAAQLSLRLRIETGEGVEWVGSGWRE